MTDRRVHDKISALWAKWPQIKDTTVEFSFRDWVKKEHGFTYKGVSDQGLETIAVVDRVYDKEKYTWFLLQC